MRLPFGNPLARGLVGLALVGGCEAKSTPGLELVPQDANLVAGVDLGALETWPVTDGSSLHRRIPGLEAFASASERCGVPLQKATAHLALGETIDDLMLIVSAPGVAKGSTLRCAIDVVDLGSTLRVDESSDGAVLVATDDGDAVVGVARGDDLLVVVGKGWRDRLDAEPTPSGPWHRSARPQNAVWFAGRSPSFLPPTLGVDASSIQSITGYLELDADRIGLVATVTTIDAASTESVRQALATAIESIGSGLYLPPHAVEALAPRVDENEITWDAELDRGAIGSLDARWLDALEIPGTPPPSLAELIDEAIKGSSGPLEAPKAVDTTQLQLDSTLLTGIPVCDEYLGKYLRCMQTKFPESAESVRDALAQASKAWKDAAEGPGATAIEEVCRTTLDDLEDSMRALGCDW